LRLRLCSLSLRCSPGPRPLGAQLCSLPGGLLCSLLLLAACPPSSGGPADGGATRLTRAETYTGLMTPVFGSVIRATDKALDEMVVELKARAEAAAQAPPRRA
jgi:hypothetical protein